MTDPRLVSVVIPAFNGAQYLAEALDSVLRQTYAPIELTVIDDGSTDDTREVVTRFAGQVHYVHQTHQGLGMARNHGVRLSRGDMIAFLDADDVWSETKTARQVARLEAEPTVDMVFGLVEEFHSPELLASGVITNRLREGTLPGYLAGTMLINRHVFWRVGGFEAWKVGEFVDWYLKAIEAGLTSDIVSEVVLRRRLHAGNMGIRHRAERGDYIRILKNALDRRRADAPGGPTT